MTRAILLTTLALLGAACFGRSGEPTRAQPSPSGPSLSPQSIQPDEAATESTQGTCLKEGTGVSAEVIDSFGEQLTLNSAEGAFLSAPQWAAEIGIGNPSMPHLAADKSFRNFPLPNAVGGVYYTKESRTVSGTWDFTQGGEDVLEAYVRALECAEVSLTPADPEELGDPESGFGICGDVRYLAIEESGLLSDGYLVGGSACPDQNATFIIYIVAG